MSEGLTPPLLHEHESKKYKKGLFKLLRVAVGGAQTPLPSSAVFAHILLAIINKILIGL